MPMTPFSLCSTTSRPSGRWLATRVGRPMPRLTTAPSGMSRATRIAISTRLHFFALLIENLRASPFGIRSWGGPAGSCRPLRRRGGGAEAAGRGRDPVDPDDPLDEDAGRDHGLRIELAEGDD